MKKGILSILFNAVALLLLSQLFESYYIEGFGTAILASLILAILNVSVKPILVVLTLPITILSLGLFLLVINTVTLWITQAVIGSSFVIDGIIYVFIGAVLLSIFNLFINKIIK